MKSNFLLITCTLLLFLLSGCTKATVTHPLVKKEIEGIEDFSHDFKLPTFMPYKVKETSLFNYNDGKILGRKDGNFILEVSFRGNAENEFIIISIQSEIDLKNSTGAAEKAIRLSDGTEAEYYYNGSSQIVTWNNSGLNYSILVYLKEKGEEQYSLEELKKIADSLEPYYKG